MVEFILPINSVIILSNLREKLQIHGYNNCKQRSLCGRPGWLTDAKTRKTLWCWDGSSFWWFTCFTWFDWLMRTSAQVSRLTPPVSSPFNIADPAAVARTLLAAQHSPVCMILAPNGPCSPHLISFCDSLNSAEMLLPLGSFPVPVSELPLHDLTQYSPFCGRTSCLITSVPQALKVPEGEDLMCVFGT